MYLVLYSSIERLGMHLIGWGLKIDFEMRVCATLKCGLPWGNGKCKLGFKTMRRFKDRALVECGAPKSIDRRKILNTECVSAID